MILHPQTGNLLDLGHRAYRPSAALARFVKTRDRTCTFPSCQRTAAHGDLDHQRRYRQGDPNSGGTDRANLHPPCKNHHILRHQGRWTLHTDPATGRKSWTSPTGHNYPIEPVDHRPHIATTDQTPKPKPPATTEVSDVCPF
jgi:hypothetical protein